MEASEELPGRCKEWKAMQSADKIVVHGWCVFQGSGFGQELERRDSDDPGQLVLERVVSFDRARNSGTIKGIAAEYIEQTDTPYETVRIVPDGPTIEVMKGA